MPKEYDVYICYNKQSADAIGSGALIYKDLRKYTYSVYFEEALKGSQKTADKDLDSSYRIS